MLKRRHRRPRGPQEKVSGGFFWLMSSFPRGDVVRSRTSLTLGVQGKLDSVKGQPSFWKWNH